jgi:hypothetical protein
MFNQVAPEQESVPVLEMGLNATLGESSIQFGPKESSRPFNQPLQPFAIEQTPVLMENSLPLVAGD